MKYNNMFLETLADIQKAVKRAREKHPRFAENDFHAVSIATEELGELAQAVNDGDKEKARKEALDAVAVLVRFLEEL